MSQPINVEEVRSKKVVVDGTDIKELLAEAAKTSNVDTFANDINITEDSQFTIGSSKKKLKDIWTNNIDFSNRATISGGKGDITIEAEKSVNIKGKDVIIDGNIVIDGKIVDKEGHVKTGGDDGGSLAESTLIGIFNNRITVELNEIIDVIPVTSEEPIKIFPLKHTPSDAIVMLFINGFAYIENEDFTVNRREKKLQWTNDLFDISSSLASKILVKYTPTEYKDNFEVEKIKLFVTEDGEAIAVDDAIVFIEDKENEV